MSSETSLLRDRDLRVVTLIDPSSSVCGDLMAGVSERGTSLTLSPRSPRQTMHVSDISDGI